MSKVHYPRFPGQTPLCRAPGCGAWLAMDGNGSARAGEVTCGNCLRVIAADPGKYGMRLETEPDGQRVLYLEGE